MKEIKFPDGSYSILCGNAGNQKCLDECVFEGKGRWFERNRKVTLDRVPTGSTDHLDTRLQFKIYKAKQDIVIDHLRGEGTIYEAVDFIQGQKEMSHGNRVYQGRRHPHSETDTGNAQAQQDNGK